MDNPDTRVDIAQNDVRGAHGTPQESAARGEVPTMLVADAPVEPWPPSPTAGRSSVGNPRRVRL